MNYVPSSQSSSFSHNSNNSKNIITNILGPLSLHYYNIVCPNGFEKKILIFGEQHTLKKKISDVRSLVPIDIFISEIINQLDKRNQCVDFYLEDLPKKTQGWNNTLRGGTLKIDQTKPNIYNWSGFKRSSTKGSKIHDSNNSMEQVRLFFNNCDSNNQCIIQGEKKENVRLHRFDLRSGPLIRSGISKLIGLRGRCPKNSKITPPFTEEILKYLLAYDFSREEEKTFLDTINKLLSSPNNNFTNEFKKFRNKIKKSYNKFIKTQNNYLPDLQTKGQLNEIVLHYIKTGKEFCNISLFSIDLYLLSKIFSEFDSELHKIVNNQGKTSIYSKRSRGPEKCKIKTIYNNTPQPKAKEGTFVLNKNTTSPKYIIIYAGLAHTNVYKNIINHYYPDGIILNIDNENPNSVNIAKSNINKKGMHSFENLIEDFIQ